MSGAFRGVLLGSEVYEWVSRFGGVRLVREFPALKRMFKGELFPER